jgi:hypothetical protein
MQAYFHHFMEIIVMLFIALVALQLGMLFLQGFTIIVSLLIDKDKK